MFKAILLQVALVMVAAALTIPWLGMRGIVSVGLGGAAYILPNLLFVVRLHRATTYGQASAVTFFVGELLKVLLTIALLAVALRWADVHWLALLVGLFVALKANLFAFLLKT